MPIRERYVTSHLLTALADTRVVVVQGARQVGKTTLVRDVVERLEGRLVSLDDAVTRASAMADPAGFLRQFPSGLLAIDEVQRVPELVLALKLDVDRDTRPGRFLLTGSADLLRVPAMQDSLAGRAEGVELFGFSQGELTDHREGFIDRLMAGDTFSGFASDLHRHDYLVRACAGSYPEAVARTAGRRRDAWLDNYLQRVVERDAPDVSGSRRLADLPVVLRLVAARSAGELNVSSLASDASIPIRSLTSLIDLLQTLYLVQLVPAWSTNLSKRVVSRPKAMVLDTGLAARLVQVTPSGASPAVSGELAGSLLETFVAGEIRRQLGWCEVQAQLHHYRDHDGAEVDLVLHTADGRVAGIEVKASSTVTARDTRWLARLRDQLGDRFVAGAVLHTGTTSASFGDRIHALPMDVLWAT